MKPHDYVVSVAHGDDLVLLNPMTEKYFSLNSTGRIIWSALQDRETLDSIVDQLAKQFPTIPRSALREDVDKLTRSLLEHSLVKEV
jgi:hypothetical protein